MAWQVDRPKWTTLTGSADGEGVLSAFPAYLPETFIVYPDVKVLHNVHQP